MVAIAWPAACTLCCGMLMYGLIEWIKLQREKSLSARALDAAVQAVRDVELMRKNLKDVQDDLRAVHNVMMERRL